MFALVPTDCNLFEMALNSNLPGDQSVISETIFIQEQYCLEHTRRESGGGGSCEAENSDTGFGEFVGTNKCVSLPCRCLLLWSTDQPDTECGRRLNPKNMAQSQSRIYAVYSLFKNVQLYI